MTNPHHNAANYLFCDSHIEKMPRPEVKLKMYQSED